MKSSALTRTRGSAGVRPTPMPAPDRDRISLTLRYVRATLKWKLDGGQSMNHDLWKTSADAASCARGRDSNSVTLVMNELWGGGGES